MCGCRKRKKEAIDNVKKSNKCDRLDNSLSLSEKVPNVEHFALSFSGCGFLGSYHFGVMISFYKHGQKFLEKIKRYAGTSGGSLVATIAVLSPDRLEEGLGLLYKLAEEINKLRCGALSRGFYLEERLAQIIEPFIPEDISPAQNRLFISITEQHKRVNRIVSKFSSREYLIKCLMASCFVPMYSGGCKRDPPKIDGKRYIDGGLSDNLPVFDDMKTITVSPFSGSAEVSPFDIPFLRILAWQITFGRQKLFFNLKNLTRLRRAFFPPSVKRLKQIYEFGYQDGKEFLRRNNYLEISDS